MKVTLISLFLFALTGICHAQDSALERQAGEFHITMAIKLNALRQELVDLKTVPSFSAALVQQTNRLITTMEITVQRYEAEMEVLISAANTRTDRDSLHATQQFSLREASPFFLLLRI